MATLRRHPRSRTGSARQDRGSCSSTASCPVFSGSYSDQEEEYLLRIQSSPVLQGSFSSLGSSTSPSSKGSFSSLQGTVPCLQNYSPCLQGSLPSLQGSLPNIRRSISQLKRRSLGYLENSSPNEWTTSLQSCNGSSSDEDGSWDTNSWSSGATCLLRMPIKQESSQVSRELDGQNPTAYQESSSDKLENEIIYQNIAFSCTAGKAENKTECTPRDSTSQRKDTGNQGVSSSCQSKNGSIVSPHQQNEKAADRHKFSQFLNELTSRVMKSNGESPQQPPTPVHHEKPLPTSTLSQLPLYPDPKNPPPLFTSATNNWYSPTSCNLQTIREYDPNDLNNSNHQWSKTLPICKILEPEDVLRKLKTQNQSNPEHHVKTCTKIQTQPTTGRFYLETDIDRVRRLDELVANGSLGREKSLNGLDKGKERGNRIPWERNGGLGAEKDRKEKDKRKDSPWERDKAGKKGRTNDKERKNPSWEQNQRAEIGREKHKKGFKSYESRQSQPCPVFSWPEGFPRVSYRYTSLPRPVNISESDGEMRQGKSSVHDHKDDLRKRLSYTTHKLEMVETEFDSTRQYLETELRRAQEELEKFTEKLRRIQSSYSALQRINQDLEDKMCRTSQHHEQDKRALSREIIVLNNHLMEAKITINKLREDNDLYRKDCNLAARLLQCSKSHYRAHKLSELPLDFQERISSYMEKHSRGRGATIAMCHTNYPEEVPTSVIAKVLEKLEPGSDSPITCSSSSHVQDGDFLIGTGSSDHLNRRISYKSSDLYCSDTALYCPERWQETERRQSVDLHGTGLLQLHTQTSLESNPDDDPFQSGSLSNHDPPTSFHPLNEFGTSSFPASSSYSSFSLASDEKGAVSGGCGHTASSALSSSHQGLYMDWREGSSGDYDHKSLSSYEKEGPSFSKSHSIQHMALPRSPQKGTSPLYTRTASCFSEPYHSSSPRLASSHSMGSTTGIGQAQGGALENRNDEQLPEDDLSARWKQLSVEDIQTFSSYSNMAGRISPYSFSEQQFTTSPSSKLKESLYSSFQEGDDVFHSHGLDQCFSIGSPSPSHNPTPKVQRNSEKTSALYRAKNDSQDSEGSLFLSGRSKEKESRGAATSANSAKKDYVNLSVDSSAESLHHSSLEASSLQHYPAQRPTIRPRPSSSSALSVGPALPKKTSPRYQKFGSTGLTRKDSLTKAQLYGTLLN